MHLYGGIFKDLLEHAILPKLSRYSHAMLGPVLEDDLCTRAIVIQQSRPVPDCFLRRVDFRKVTNFLTNNLWCFLTTFSMALTQLSTKLPQQSHVRPCVVEYAEMIGALHLTTLLTCRMDAHNYADEIDACVKRFDH